MNNKVLLYSTGYPLIKHNGTEYEKEWTCKYNWITLPSSRNEHTIVNQLYFNNFLKKGTTGLRDAICSLKLSAGLGSESEVLIESIYPTAWRIYIHPCFPLITMRNSPENLIIDVHNHFTGVGHKGWLPDSKSCLFFRETSVAHFMFM